MRVKRKEGRKQGGKDMKGRRDKISLNNGSFSFKEMHNGQGRISLTSGLSVFVSLCEADDVGRGSEGR